MRCWIPGREASAPQQGTGSPHRVKVSFAQSWKLQVVQRTDKSKKERVCSGSYENKKMQTKHQITFWLATEQRQ